jgi:hypothetical protein
MLRKNREINAALFSVLLHLDQTQACFIFIFFRFRFSCAGIQLRSGRCQTVDVGRHVLVGHARLHAVQHKAAVRQQRELGRLQEELSRGYTIYNLHILLFFSGSP